jgi:hypothetical protein
VDITHLGGDRDLGIAQKRKEIVQAKSGEGDEN